MTEIGHNSINAETAKQLKSYLERVERLEDERSMLGADISDIYAEAKSSGFDVKVMRKLVALRKRDAEKVQAEQVVLETYAHALGMGIFG